MHSEEQDITGLLRRFESQEPGAQADLIQAVYGELRTMAQRFMARERQGHTLQTTALVHEAYLRLARMQQVSWRDRSHFFAVAARVMRHLLVDHARRHLGGGLGGKQNLLPLEPGLFIPESPERWLQLLDIDRALDRLGEVDQRASQVVELRYFGGLSVDETAAALGLSTRSVERDWIFGRAWLRDELNTE
jgi:RNA polymerase sigma-70 factor, ECF subfamily